MIKNIVTNRLRIIPLSVFQLKMYAQIEHSLIADLNVNNQTWNISESIQLTIREIIIPAVINVENNPLFSTFWTIIDQESNCMVGDICFKGDPNELGEIEIGYGTHPDFQKKGFMSEAVSGIIDWAFQQENVNCIWAETDPNNLASQKVLINNCFEQIDASLTNVYWRILKNK